MSDLARPITAVAKGIREASSRAAKATTIQAVDLLTDEEVEELRALVSLGSNAGEYAFDRLKDPANAGMYLQLSDSGFINCCLLAGGPIVFEGVSEKAHWAIARHDRQKAAEEEAKAEQKRMRKEDRRNARLNLLLGWLLGLATAVIGRLMDALNLPIP